VIHLFLSVARKVDEAVYFVFVQLIEQELDMYSTKEFWLGKEFLVR
jgi:hypothetical protein